MSSFKIIVGVDGSEPSGRAVRWCARYARALDAEVIAVHVVDIPVYFGPTAAFPTPFLTPEQRAELRDVVARDWCKPLADAGVEFYAELMDGSPAAALMEIAKRENADLVVTGRRGRGGFAELLLGSTSHELSHHLGRPLLIVP